MAGLVSVCRNEKLLKRSPNEMETSFPLIPHWGITLALEDCLWIALFLRQCSTEPSVMFRKLLVAQWVVFHRL